MCLVPAPREALRKCRFSAFIMISPNVNDRVKITKGWQPHQESGCVSRSTVLRCSSQKVDFYNWLRKAFFSNSACCLSPSLFIFHTWRKTKNLQVGEKTHGKRRQNKKKRWITEGEKQLADCPREKWENHTQDFCCCPPPFADHWFLTCFGKKNPVLLIETIPPQVCQNWPVILKLWTFFLFNRCV